MSPFADANITRKGNTLVFPLTLFMNLGINLRQFTYIAEPPSAPSMAERTAIATLIHFSAFICVNYYVEKLCVTAYAPN